MKNFTKLTKEQMRKIAGGGEKACRTVTDDCYIMVDGHIPVFGSCTKYNDVCACFYVYAQQEYYRPTADCVV